MCAIVGALLRNVSLREIEKANLLLSNIFTRSQARGRDGVGWTVITNNDHDAVRNTARGTQIWTKKRFFDKGFANGVLIGNLRAEPTTEYVKEKTEVDQQPYSAGGWTIVHNGTIANDAQLRTGKLPTSVDSAAIAEILGSKVQDTDRFTHFVNRVKQLKGSYAILAVANDDPSTLYTACNYRPIWYVVTEFGFIFASTRDSFSKNYIPQMLPPYSAHKFSIVEGRSTHQMIDLPRTTNRKALVVCSGGLDSVVAAAFAKEALGYEIELLHFRYGSRAEGPEVKAVQAVGERLGVPVTLFPLNVYKKTDSPLLDADSVVAGGEEGAEFAHEWVPARNLLLLSVATAYAEANGFSTIVLGNNLEEAGAYPDNEPEFIQRFNDLLPFAVADGKGMQVIMPVGNLMKHEIVALGKQLNAPLDATWSCYRAGSLHCGTCGPCYMRRTAFEINGLAEVIKYER